MRPLVVFALKEESQAVFDSYDVLYTGVGKVNASYAFMKRLALSRPSLVINVGTAGSRKHKTGQIINCLHFIQRDMDVTALGFEKFKTPFSDVPVSVEYGEAIAGLIHGVCGTGDNFDASDAAQNFDVVDMEAYVLALLCQRENIPFLCLKYVSDGADQNAKGDWHEALKHTAVELYRILQEAGYMA